VTYFTTGGRGPLIPEIDEPSLGHITNEPYLEQLHYLNDLSDDDLPTVLSTSYGEDEQSLPKPYAVEVCMLFLSLTSRGVSIIFASGDSGPGSSCASNDGNNTAKYLPVFPATCPYVTSVGGTTGVEPERAASFSSGGFSDYFLQPSYQRDAVQEYVDCHGNSTRKTYYHRYGRATPDVSAQAANYLIVNKGQTVSIGGTRSVIRLP
jgi:tripeptidyl-peptidase I